MSDAELAQKLAEDMVRWHFLYELFNSEKQDIFKLVEMVICILASGKLDRRKNGWPIRNATFG